MTKNQTLVPVTEIVLSSSRRIELVTERKLKKMVKIAAIEDGFKHRFQSFNKDLLPKRVVCGYDLKQEETDLSVMNIIGPRFLTRMADLWSMLLRQPNGESGELLTNGMANVFYVFDGKEVCAVILYWTRSGWHLDACATEDKNQWIVGSRIFVYKNQCA